MTIWVLLILYTHSPKQLFLKTFDSKTKCENHIKTMEPISEFKCVESEINK